MQIELSVPGKRNDAEIAESAKNMWAQSHTAVDGTRPPRNIA
jgi:hypothetical protein